MGDMCRQAPFFRRFKELPISYGLLMHGADALLKAIAEAAYADALAGTRGPKFCLRSTCKFDKASSSMMTWVLKPCSSTLPGPVVCSVNVFAVARTNPRWKL